MSEISAIGNAVVGNVRPASPTTPTTAVEVSAPAVECSTASTVDHVTFSEHAQMLEKVRQLPEVRQERIDTIKDAIANDTYMSDVKINTAFDRLIDEVAG
ncbi:MAG: flagellar biosynthesis anti-sigma factor FlgM [Phycisphaerales bacterium]|jgi:anti-sigma28 factor (negative regulator of flagellin synthesis)|tara:strand:- start:197 stop:496 length:300 start_codon:yes stop_codon:yes gene_type:complete